MCVRTKPPPKTTETQHHHDHANSSLILHLHIPKHEGPHVTAQRVVDQAPPAAQDDLVPRQDDALAADVVFIPVAILEPLHEGDALPAGDILYGGDGMQVAANFEGLSVVESFPSEVVEILARLGGLQGSGTLLGELHGCRGCRGLEVLPFFLEFRVEGVPGFGVREGRLVDGDPLAPLVLLHVPVVDRVGGLGVLGGQIVGEFTGIVLGFDPVGGPLLQGIDHAHAEGGLHFVIPGTRPGTVEHLHRTEIEFKVDETVIKTELVVDEETARVAVRAEVVDLLARE